MNLTELQSRFEVLFEDLRTAGTKGLDNYETSIVFTHVQEALIRELAAAKNLDPIASIVKFHEETSIKSSNYSTASAFTKVDNPLYVLDYFIKSNTKGDVPAIQKDNDLNFIHRMLASDYKYPPKNLAYVVMGETDIIVFPPFNFGLSSLVTKYVEYPPPIILEPLSGGDTINGISTTSNPTLPDAFHLDLVNNAVRYAIEVYVGQPEKQLSNDDPGNKQ